ncbi:hypothetical protein ZIOFF_032958 [Zingiber officinale]|uniref:Uncharacterized protein n=1 Tax=Zingiber officinale TaxID=94328 RepID=A0A8J5L616_ZINOF|nr:hypothetical protein ZIOFF_032958 [Zingiber officinale]
MEELKGELASCKIVMVGGLLAMQSAYYVKVPETNRSTKDVDNFLWGSIDKRSEGAAIDTRDNFKGEFKQQFYHENVEDETRADYMLHLWNTCKMNAHLGLGRQEGSGCNNQRIKPTSLRFSDTKVGGRIRWRRFNSAAEWSFQVLQQHNN